MNTLEAIFWLERIQAATKPEELDQIRQDLERERSICDQEIAQIHKALGVIEMPKCGTKRRAQ